MDENNYTNRRSLTSSNFLIGCIKLSIHSSDMFAFDLFIAGNIINQLVVELLKSNKTTMIWVKVIPMFMVICTSFQPKYNCSCILYQPALPYCHMVKSASLCQTKYDLMCHQIKSLL